MLHVYHGNFFHRCDCFSINFCWHKIVKTLCSCFPRFIRVHFRTKYRLNIRSPCSISNRHEFMQFWCLNHYRCRAPSLSREAAQGNCVMSFYISISIFYTSRTWMFDQIWSHFSLSTLLANGSILLHQYHHHVVHCIHALISAGIDSTRYNIFRIRTKTILSSNFPIIPFRITRQADSIVCGHPSIWSMCRFFHQCVTDTRFKLV